MNKADFFAVFRRFRILFYLDFIRFYLQKITRNKKNRAFKKKYPDVELPPDYLIYESFHLDYAKYFLDGYDTAKWLVGLLGDYKKLESVTLLDWGCGPGRIVRHLPKILDQSCEIYGTDYNKYSIEWCSKHIDNVSFHLNSLNPPLAFQDNSFDVIYGISIFTHLSEKSHHEWIQELVRVLKKDGILLVTTHGEAFKRILSTKELEKFNKGELVIRDKVKEGHKVFGAFHPPQFTKGFFSEYVKIIDFIPGNDDLVRPEQDVWVLTNVDCML